MEEDESDLAQFTALSGYVPDRSTGKVIPLQARCGPRVWVDV